MINKLRVSLSTLLAKKENVISRSLHFESCFDPPGYGASIYKTLFQNTKYVLIDSVEGWDSFNMLKAHYRNMSNRSRGVEIGGTESVAPHFFRK